MSKDTKKNPQIPVLVSTRPGGTAQVYIPDFGLHVDGMDIHDALASATLVATLMQRYYLDHDVAYSYTFTYDDVSRIGGSRDIVTFITLDR